jgi:hypothetical protein
MGAGAAETLDGPGQGPLASKNGSFSALLPNVLWLLKHTYPPFLTGCRNIVTFSFKKYNSKPSTNQCQSVFVTIAG